MTIGDTSSAPFTLYSKNVDSLKALKTLAREKMKKTLYVFISLITTYMLLFEKNVYALETSKIFSDEINMIIVMGLL